MLTKLPVPHDLCVADPNSRLLTTYRGVNARLARCLKSVLNVKVLVGAFNQEKALVGAFSVIVQPVVEPMDRFAALLLTLRLLGSWPRRSRESSS